jgi:hypothetical protein
VPLLSDDLRTRAENLNSRFAMWDLGLYDKTMSHHHHKQERTSED